MDAGRSSCRPCPGATVFTLKLPLGPKRPFHVKPGCGASLVADRGNATSVQDVSDRHYDESNVIRPGVVAVIAVVAAMLGGTTALVLGKAVGWIDDDGAQVQTVLVPTPDGATPAADPVEGERGKAARRERLRRERDLPQARRRRGHDLRRLRRGRWTQPMSRGPGLGLRRLRRGLCPHELARRSRPPARRTRRRRRAAVARCTSSSGTASAFPRRSSAGTSSTTSGFSRSTRRSSR